MTVPVEGGGNVDTLGSLMVGVLGNLIGRLSQIPENEDAKSAAIFSGILSTQAHEHAQSAIWRTIPEPPLHGLVSLAGRLSDISYTLHEIAHDDGPLSILGILKGYP